MKIQKAILSVALLLVSGAVFSSEIIANNLTINRVMYITSNYSDVSERGEVWIKLDTAISSFHTGCSGANSDAGYVVAVYPNDEFANQTLSGLLTAKAASKKIRVGIEDSKKNGRGICTLAWYEILE